MTLPAPGTNAASARLPGSRFGGMVRKLHFCRHTVPFRKGRKRLCYRDERGGVQLRFAYRLKFIYCR